MLTVAAIVVQQIALYGPSGPVLASWFPAADKVQHAIGFALPMLLVLLTLHTYAVRAGRRLRPIWPAVVAGVLAVNAMLSEVVQARPQSGRTGDPVDAVADLIGIALGWLVFLGLRDRLPARGRA